MDVKGFDGRTINVGDKVAYPSRDYVAPGGGVMRKGQVVKITQRSETVGRVVTTLTVELERPEGSRYWYPQRIALRNLNTVVRL